MKKKTYLFIAATLLAALAGCGTENSAAENERRGHYKGAGNSGSGKGAADVSGRRCSFRKRI